MIYIIQSEHLSNNFIALLMDFLNTEEKRQRRLVHLPMGRFGEAVELAKAALFCEWGINIRDKHSNESNGAPV